MTGLQGRRVLVTGASSGIGEACAQALADAGARVACLARRKDRVEALAERLGGAPITADLTDVGAAQAGVERAAEALGGLDGLVNNAGVMRLGLVADGRVEDWRAMLDLNVLGLLVATQAAIGHLRSAGGGDIVNISSMAGRRVPGATAGVYSGTKFAVHAVSEGLRRELHDEGIRVTIVSPGFVETELGDDISDDEVRARVERMKEDVGLAPSDVARQVVRVMAEPAHVTLHEVALLPTAQN